MQHHTVAAVEVAVVDTESAADWGTAAAAAVHTSAVLALQGSRWWDGQASPEQHRMVVRPMGRPAALDECHKYSNMQWE